MRPAADKAAERWGMSSPDHVKPTSAKVPEKRDFKAELGALRGVQPNEPFVRSDAREIREPERDE